MKWEKLIDVRCPKGIRLRNTLKKNNNKIYGNGIKQLNFFSVFYISHKSQKSDIKLF